MYTWGGELRYIGVHMCEERFEEYTLNKFYFSLENIRKQGFCAVSHQIRPLNLPDLKKKKGKNPFS